MPRSLVALWDRGTFSRPVEPTADQLSNLNQELTLVVVGALRLVAVVLDIVPRSRVEPASSREQMETSGDQ
jgi:hypothetical protein